MSTDLFAERARKIDTRAGARAGLTSIFDVTDEPVVNGITSVIESTIVMPVDIAVGVEVFANNCTDDVWTAIDSEVG